MLPKKSRLAKKKDIDFVFKKGKALNSDFLIFKFLKNQINENRFGFIVSKKISNKAAKRNLVKRRLRAAVVSYFKDYNNINNKKSIDVLIITLPKIVNKSFLEIKEVVHSFLKKID